MLSDGIIRSGEEQNIRTHNGSHVRNVIPLADTSFSEEIACPQFTFVLTIITAYVSEELKYDLKS